MGAGAILPDISQILESVESTLKDKKSWAKPQKKANSKNILVTFEDIKSFLGIDSSKKKLNKKSSKSKRLQNESEHDSLKTIIRRVNSKKKSKVKELEEVIDKEAKEIGEETKEDKKSNRLVSEVLDYSALERHFLIEKPLYFGKESSYLAHFESEFGSPYESEEVDAYVMGDTHTMDEAEAQDKIQQIMADATTGGYSEVSHKDKQRLSNWVTFNPALFKLYQSTSIMPTGNVDIRYI